MQASAVFFGSGDGSPTSLQTLMDRCRGEGLDVRSCQTPAELQDLPGSLPDGPALLFLPAIEEDCLGIKLSQAAGAGTAARVICLYAETMPPVEYLCLAFRAGVDDVIALDRIPERMELYITRARKLLASRMHNAEGNGLSTQALQAEAELLKRRLSKQQERILALSSAAQRLATGELNLGRETPPVLIVSASQSQAAAAGDVARKLGFEVAVAGGADEALAQAQRRPPRVVLVDGTLEGAEPGQVARSLREKMGANPVVICAWSSDPAQEDKVLVPGSGIDDFVPKSTTGEGQARLVAALLGSLR
jgi:CheY-like chemotaxis protein